MLVEYENQYNHPPSEETKPKKGYNYNAIMKGNRNVKYLTFLTMKTYVKKYKRRPLA